MPVVRDAAATRRFLAGQDARVGIGSEYSRGVAEELTDRAFWEAYWRSRPPTLVPRSWYYAGLLQRTIAGRGYRSFVELGGFPGSFGVYARRYLGFQDVAIVDSYIDRAYLERFLGANGLTADDVDVVEADIFELELPRRYDVVLSGGLIEHFADPTRALERHVAALAPGGTLVVTVPNFRGLNGLLQRGFDRENLAHHNVSLMEPEALAERLRALDSLTEVEGFYYGAFRAWLEGASSVGRVALFGVQASGYLLDRVRPRTRLTGRDVVGVGRLP